MFRHLRVRLDGSPAAEAVLPLTANLALGLQAQVTLLHVRDPAGHGLRDPEDARVYLAGLAGSPLPDPARVIRRPPFPPLTVYRTPGVIVERWCFLHYCATLESHPPPTAAGCPAPPREAPMLRMQVLNALERDAFEIAGRLHACPAPAAP
jgi:hypothetical protein